MKQLTKPTTENNDSITNINSESFFARWQVLIGVISLLIGITGATYGLLQEINNLKNEQISIVARIERLESHDTDFNRRIESNRLDSEHHIDDNGTQIARVKEFLCVKDKSFCSEK